MTCPLQVSATDEDSGVYGTVRYSLLPGSSTLFSLDNTTGQSECLVLAQSLHRLLYMCSGELSVVADVDFESLSPSPGATQLDMQLVIQASDGAVPAMTSSVMVTVTITDENDNAPEFVGTPYHAVLRENSAPGEEVIVVSGVTAVCSLLCSDVINMCAGAGN